MKPKLKIYLRSYRRRWGLSQSDLAHLVGLKSGTTISRYRDGVRLLLGFLPLVDPSVMTRQRWPFFQASRNAGAVSTVSARALIEEKPTLMSFAHDGTSPQRICCGIRLPS